MLIINKCLISLVVLLLFTKVSYAERKVALVMGNSNYQHVGRLSNPTHDADDIAIALEEVGFEVSKAKDLGYQKMRIALMQFSDKALGADIALIYYAGHGIELNRHNFLIPTDAELKKDIDVSYEAMSLDLVSQAVSGAKGLRLILLDACRDNPFEKSMARTLGTRSIGRGLAKIEPATGTLVSYAAREGTVAADGVGRNSPYTAALIEHLSEPGLEIQFMFRKVRDSVIASTGGRQEPFTYGSLPGKQIFLNQSEPKQKIQGPVTSSESGGSAELVFWNSIKDKKERAYFEAYLKQYPSGLFSEVANLEIAGLGPPAAKIELPRTSEPQDRHLVENSNGFLKYACGEIEHETEQLSWFVGPDRNMNWREAREWVNRLSVCGKNSWRMPSTKELKSLYDPARIAGLGHLANGKRWPARMDKVFRSIGGGSWVWADRRSGEKFQAFNFNQGLAVWIGNDDAGLSTRAFAVRNF